MREALEWLGTLPRRHLLGWSLWLIGAIVLIGVSVMLSPETATTLITAFRLLPRWLQITDIVWATLAAILLVQNVIARGQQTQDRLDRIEQKVDLLILTLGAKEVPVGDFKLPPPSPQLKVGWVGVVTDTTKATSFAKVDSKRVAAIFEPVLEPTAVVNAAIAKQITINKVVLEQTSKPATKTGARYSAFLQITNHTPRSLSLHIPKGQVFENASPGVKVQNLVISEDTIISCPAGAGIPVRLPAYCLNQHLSPPSGQDGNITPLKVKFAFDSQSSVWKNVSDALK